MKKLLPALFGLALLTPLAAHAQNVNPQTGTTYPFVNSDCDPKGVKLVTFNNAAAIAATLPQAGANGNFLSGCTINVVNIGVGTVTITPTTSTFNGGSPSLSIMGGSSATIYTDATAVATGNYYAAVGSAGTAGIAATNPLNLLDNGSMQVQQRGTGARTCAANAAVTSAAYVVDRWGCSVNVGSGVAQGTALTTGLPTGATGGMKLVRQSGVLTQPICTIHEVLTSRTLPAAGGPVTLSFYAEALTGLAADNGGVINAYIIYGTGTNDGLGTMTASPALTPAWTGINATLTKAITLTTSWARYTLSATLPGTATEMGVEICFTPTATGSGATDGFAVSLAQLETNPAASLFEFRAYNDELLEAQAYYMQWADPAATVELPSSCFVTAANTTVKCGVNLPVTMRVAPTTAIGTSTSFGIVVTAGTAGTCSALTATASSNSLNSIGVTCTTAGTIALGSATPLIGAATGGILSASADF